jgi:excisionase family DNA binding protein
MPGKSALPSTASSAVDTRHRATRRHLPDDVEFLPWAAEQLGISKATAYRLAEAGEIPGLFRIGRQYRVSVPRFRSIVHGEAS